MQIRTCSRTASILKEMSGVEIVIQFKKYIA